MNSPITAVLEVKGQRVIYKNFEITFLGEYSRYENDNTFQRADGINHITGEDCQFINLKIYDNPGSGFGSWKFTGGTTIYGCQIYNNGFFSKVRGRGAGIYVQNISEKTRIIMNNIIFNNYYMGIEVWSAGKKAKTSYVKNMLLKNNIVFNNGSAGNQFKNNLIVATNDSNGINSASNIKVLDNVFYHNIDAGVNAKGDAGSVMLGRNKFTATKNIVFRGNRIYGGNNALRIHLSDSLVFEDNLVYGGYVHLFKVAVDSMNTWIFRNNSYFSKNSRNFRVVNYKDYSFNDWKLTYGLDEGSTWKNLKQFRSEDVLQITRNSYDSTHFSLAIFNMSGEGVPVDFSRFNTYEGSNYEIVDAENPEVIIKKGILKSDSVIEIPMHFDDLQMPKHNKYAQKTPQTFGVYYVRFEKEIAKPKSSKTIFGRLFKWLGF